jgi:RNA polymerase sigma-70 factor (ECF subfamily)
METRVVVDHRVVSGLFLQQRDMLLSYIHALVRDPDAAEDLFQQVVICILEREELPCPPEAFPAWCRGVARNLILHHWRDRRRRRAVPSGLLIDAVDLAFREVDEQADFYQLRSAALAECLKWVPARQRQLLTLRYTEDLTSQEIGQRLRRTAGAVRKEIARLRSQLRECIEAHLALRGEYGA